MRHAACRQVVQAARRPEPASKVPPPPVGDLCKLHRTQNLLPFLCCRGIAGVLQGRRRQWWPGGQWWAAQRSSGLAPTTRLIHPVWLVGGIEFSPDSKLPGSNHQPSRVTCLCLTQTSFFSRFLHRRLNLLNLVSHFVPTRHCRLADAFPARQAVILVRPLIHISVLRQT